MRKPSTLFLALFLTLPWLAGCNSGDQGPTSEQTKTTPGTIPPRGYTTNPNDFSNPRPINSDPLGGLTRQGTGDTLPVRTDVLPANFDVDHPTPDMILVTVHFGFDQFNIDTADRPLVEAAAKVLAADPSIRVVAVGHTDHYGSEQYNLALGDRRANSVKGYLKNSGANEAQVEILSRGKFGATPDVKKDSPEAKNDRRVDVIKVPAGAALPTGAPPATTVAPTAIEPTAVTPTKPPGS